jgi:hypothetical protein
MGAIIIDANGLRMDAVLLAAGNNRMRVVLRDAGDTIELRREGEQWISEDGLTFEFEAWIVDDSSAASELLRTELAGRVDRAFGTWLQEASLAYAAGSRGLSA